MDLSQHDAEITGTPTTIPAALARAAEKWPDDEALIEGPVRLSFGEYRELSVRIARGLISCGVQAGDRVVIWAPNSVEMAVSAMAVASAGSRAGPAHPPPHRVRSGGADPPGRAGHGAGVHRLPEP